MKPDENGKVTLKFSKAGTFVISAASASDTLVPPVLTVTVTEKSPQTGDSSTTALYMVFLAVSAMGMVVSARKFKRNANEE